MAKRKGRMPTIWEVEDELWRLIKPIIDADMIEWVKYSSYGIPFGLPKGDTDSDGDCDSTDTTQIQTWIDAPAYDQRGDLDLDGDVGYSASCTDIPIT